MKFFIYLSLIILILAPFSSITCRRNASKSKKRRNLPLHTRTTVPVTSQASSSSTSNISTPASNPSSPTINIERPYVNSQPIAVARPNPTVISRPPFISGPPQGPRIVRGVVRSPVMVRRYAVVRRSLNECPLDFHGNSLVRELNELCPRICRIRYCIQISEICCVYRDITDFHHSHIVATRLMKKK